MTRLLAAALALCLTLPAVADEARRISGGPERVALLELFTSEGCSSCPPADAWLATLTTRRELWQEVVPVAFHVDYWDHLGWPDRHARAAYSDRQRRYAAEGGVGVVYTPGLMLNGLEWRGWRRGERPAPGAAGDAGTLSVTVDDDALRIAYRPPAALGEPLVGHVAWLGFGLASRVTAGENRGRTLAQDFVVLEHAQVPLEFDGERHVATLTVPAGLDAPRLALAAWVSTTARQAPLQAAGGWLD